MITIDRNTQAREEIAANLIAEGQRLRTDYEELLARLKRAAALAAGLNEPDT